MKNKDLKQIVKEKYGAIAGQSKAPQQQHGCCSTSDFSEGLEFSMIGDDYTLVKGYNPDADLGLGCGLPTEYAGIKPGNSVLDLGSGAGNDCFVAATLAGKTGKITGLDFTGEMIQKARHNLTKTSFENIEFVQGDIEEMPLPDSEYDVVISNCVLNLVPNKNKAFAEIFRVLKPGGHFCISDVVTSGHLPQALKESAEMYAGCVAGAIDQNDYLEIVKEKGFEQIEIHKKKRIDIPENILAKNLDEKEIAKFKKSDSGIYSITLTAQKR